MFLHCMSSLILSKAEFKTVGGTKAESFSKNIVISVPARKNEFVKRKDSALKLIKDDAFLKDRYEDAKKILLNAAEKYSAAIGKSKASLLKYRNFDRDFLRPEIDAFMQSNGNNKG